MRADPASACSGAALTTVATMRSRASSPSGRPCTPPRRAHSSISHAKRTTCAPKTTPDAGELGAVALDVGERRHDEDRLGPAAQRGAVAVEDDLRLLGVGGTGDELQRHPTIVARRPDELVRSPAASHCPAIGHIDDVDPATPVYFDGIQMWIVSFELSSPTDVNEPIAPS